MLAQRSVDTADESVADLPLNLISDVFLPHTEEGSRWDIELKDGLVKEITLHDASSVRAVGINAINASSALLTPSLCHPHIHLDKAFLLSHPRYSMLGIVRGDFQEAMELTGKAKAKFTLDDLIERGQRLIDESVVAGVTHMRAFVELDAIVGTKCLEAGLLLKKQAEGRCHIQLCAFAQLPLFSATHDDIDGHIIRGLMKDAAKERNVEVLGSTPYVEDSEHNAHKNVSWIIDLAMTHSKHLDLHLDYNLDGNSKPMIHSVLQTLKQKEWNRNVERTVVLGHCTRLTMFEEQQWRDLANSAAELPIHFVGLPTSDIFMTPPDQDSRGTLNIPQLIKKYSLNGCIGINNIGNAFTPYGSCDPLALACLSVGLYRAGKKTDAELLYECVSDRARQAIGIMSTTKTHHYCSIRSGDEASFLLFDKHRSTSWKALRSISQATYLYDGTADRRSFFKGKLVD